MVADPQPVEGVVRPAAGLDRLAGRAPRVADFTRETLQGPLDPVAIFVGELLELAERRTRELDLVGRQSMSSSPTVRPLA